MDREAGLPAIQLLWDLIQRDPDGTRDVEVLSLLPRESSVGEFGIAVSRLQELGFLEVEERSLGRYARATLSGRKALVGWSPGMPDPTVGRKRTRGRDPENPVCARCYRPKTNKRKGCPCAVDPASKFAGRVLVEAHSIADAEGIFRTSQLSLRNGQKIGILSNLDERGFIVRVNIRRGIWKLSEKGRRWVVANASEIAEGRDRWRDTWKTLAERFSWLSAPKEMLELLQSEVEAAEVAGVFVESLAILRGKRVAALRAGEKIVEVEW